MKTKKIEVRYFEVSVELEKAISESKWLSVSSSICKISGVCDITPSGNFSNGFAHFVRFSFYQISIEDAKKIIKSHIK